MKMADWKTQVTYNFNPSYHAYAFVYQSEQNPSGLNENGVVDLSSYNSAATQAAYTARIEESYSQQRYQDTGLVNVGGTQATHLLQAGPDEVAGTAARRTRMSSTSNSEAHTSPDSWSSVSSREESLPQTDSSVWAEKDDDSVVIVRSPDGSEDVSSSVLEEPRSFASSSTPLNPPPTASKTLSASAQNCTKPVVRTTFSQRQMETLIKRFNVQKYLSPPEMKYLAEQTGITYKQVKTWFQNRRMKLRKYQRDSSWASGRCTCYNDVSNMTSPHLGDGRPQLRDHYNQHTTPAAYKSPQNLAYYLGAGSAAFQHWPSGSPQAAGWSVAPGTNHLEFVPNRFNSSNFMHSPNLNTEEGEAVSSQNSENSSLVLNVNQ